MAQTLPSISIADKYCPSLKRFNAFVFKPLNTLSACANFSTSRTSSNSMLLMSPWRINSFIQPWKNEPILPKSSTFNTGLPKKTISAAYGSGIGMSRSNNFNRLGKCLVVPPLPRGRKPRAIIKFLGGAFIGAVPERTYSLFMDLLAKEGFLIVAVPYNVTFEHAQAAKETGVTTVIRLNKRMYDKRNFTDHGLTFYDLYFPDGSCPPERIVQQFLEIVEGSSGSVAVHCKDLNWQVGDLYTPADAVAQGLKGVALNDIKNLVKTISDWLENLS